MSDAGWKRFGAQVKRARTAAKLGLRETARNIGVEKTCLLRVERGHRCEVESYLRICDAFNIPHFAVIAEKVP